LANFENCLKTLGSVNEYGASVNSFFFGFGPKRVKKRVKINIVSNLPSVGRTRVGSAVAQKLWRDKPGGRMPPSTAGGTPAATELEKNIATEAGCRRFYDDAARSNASDTLGALIPASNLIYA
jgi:hypothetical protein